MRHLFAILLLTSLMLLNGCASQTAAPVSTASPTTDNAAQTHPLSNFTDDFSGAPATPSATTTAAAPSNMPSTIALLLPLQGNFSAAGNAIKSGFMAAAQQQQQNGQAVPKIAVYDTSQHTDVAELYQQAVSNGAEVVVGPLDKNAVQSLASSSAISVPTLALNYTADNDLPQQFYEFGLSPLDETTQVAQKMWQDGYRSVIMIVPAGTWGQNLANTFQTQWSQLGGKITATLTVASNQNINAAIKNILHFQQQRKDKAGIRSYNMQRRQDFDAIFLAQPPLVARQIVPLLKYYDAGNIPVYATSLVYSGSPSANADNDLNGVKFCDMPWVLDNLQQPVPLYQQLANNAPDFPTNARLYGLGVDSFGLALQLNQAAALSNGISGVTGYLTLDKQQHWQRQLEWAQFQQGVPVVLPDTK